jgi:hypothetical protein
MTWCALFIVVWNWLAIYCPMQQTPSIQDIRFYYCCLYYALIFVSQTHTPPRCITPTYTAVVTNRKFQRSNGWFLSFVHFSASRSWSWSWVDLVHSCGAVVLAMALRRPCDPCACHCTRPFP